MKTDIFDLMDSYEDMKISLKETGYVPPQNIQNRVFACIPAKRKLRPVRIALIAAAIALCLGTTVLATTDLFTAVVDYLRASVDKDFGGSGDSGPDVLDSIPAGEALGVLIYNGEVVFIRNEEDSWCFYKGQKVDIFVEIVTDGKRSEENPGYGVYYGYVRCDEYGNALEQAEVYHEQTFGTSACCFEIPEDGFYYFYFLNVSSDPYELDTFTVSVAE